MEVSLSLDEKILRGRSLQTLTQILIQGLLIQDYLEGELSLGEVAESMGWDYQQTRDWFHKRGIATGIRTASSFQQSLKHTESL